MTSRYALHRAELDALLAEAGEPRYRVEQVWDALYRQRVPLEDATALPRALRKQLTEELPLALDPVVESVGDSGATHKWLWTCRAGGAQIKTVLQNWKVGEPTVINDKPVNVVQGVGTRGFMATLYFDKTTGLLTRVLRYTASPIGRVPTQVDYAEYRDVNGVKMPFKWTFSWLDGRDTIEIRDYQVNVAISAAVFGKPALRK